MGCCQRAVPASTQTATYTLLQCRAVQDREEQAGDVLIDESVTCLLCQTGIVLNNNNIKKQSNEKRLHKFAFETAGDRPTPVNQSKVED